VLLGGCAVIQPRPLDAALFPPPPMAPAPRLAATVALAVAIPDQSYTNPPTRLHRHQAQLPIGRIVEAAAQLALREQFERVEVGASDGLALRLTDIVPQVESALIYMVPVPGGLIDRVDVTTRLAFRLALVAPDGSLRWSRVCDSGAEPVKARRERFLAQQPMEAAMQRRFHEQAARLMRDAAADLRRWLEQERRRERVL
jgi:hypothetical protein